MTTRRLIVTGTAVAALLLAGCGGSTGTDTGGGSGSTITVGAAFSLSGQVAFAGVPAQNAIKVADTVINADPTTYLGAADRKIVFSVSDAGVGVPTATSAISGFASDSSVAAVIGPSLSTQAIAAAALAQQVEIPLVVPSATASTITDAGSFVFQVAIVGQSQVAPLVDYAMEKFNPSKVGIVYTSDNQGNVDLGKSAEELFTQAGAAVTTSTVLYADTNFASTITKFQSAGIQAAYLVLPSPADASFLVQAQQAGLDVQFLGSSTLGAAIPNSNGAATGAVYTSDYNVALDTPLNKTFVQDYNKQFGTDPDVYAAQAFSSALIVAAAVKSISGDISRSALTDAIAKVQKVPVVVGDGSFSFDENRKAATNVQLLVVGADGSSTNAVN